MRILITGNMGYVGPVVVRHLRQRFPDAKLIGFDCGFFAGSLTTLGRFPETCLDEQIFGDVRQLPRSLVENTDAVIHLAAISNDPMGNQFAEATDSINRAASVALAENACAAGVKHFVFASSCSVYGTSVGAPRCEDDPVDPLTAYARSKIGTEQGLQDANLRGMTVTCLRFATACGFSSRLRLDLVLNDFVASALATGEILVLSDGSPWRPLIHVRDMARAIEWAITRTGDSPLVVNAGDAAWNYSVRDLAEAVAQEIPGTSISINTSAPPDRRSYLVDFSRFRALAPDHQPQMTLSATIIDLLNGLRRIGFCDRQFRSSPLARLPVLADLVKTGMLSPSLSWQALADPS